MFGVAHLGSPTVAEGQVTGENFSTLSPPAKVQKVEPARRSGLVGEFGAYSGAAEYQDLQLPIATWDGRRGDGSRVEAASSPHAGIPVGARLTLGWKEGFWKSAMGIDGMLISSLVGSPQTSRSTYQRFEMTGKSSASMRVSRLSGMLSLGGGLALRRSLYRNVNSGHYVDSVLPAVAFDYQGDRGILVGISLASSAKSLAGYDTGDGIGRGHIAGSSAHVSEYTARLGYRLNPGLILEASAARENVRVEIPQNAAYRGFGLVVAPWDEGPRTVELPTTSFTLGFRRDF
jgi:hypothetical protein